MDFLTSDQHYFHTNVIRYAGRPFLNREEMNRVLIENHNAVVSPNDTVLHFGDFAFASIEWQKKTLSKLNGKHILYLGNHDRSLNVMRQIGFVEVYDKPIDITYKGLRLRLSHYPFAPKQPIEGLKFLNRRPSREGCDWLLCGHVHEKWKSLENMVNVGVDVWNYKPVSFDEIYNFIISLKEKNIDESLISNQFCY